MRQGESFEQYVLNLLHLDGFKLMRKTDPPVRILRWHGGRNFTGVFIEEGMLDLTGPMNGFHAEIEVKDCKGMRFPMSKIRAHQLRRMEDVYLDKSLSGLALRLRGEKANDDHVLLIPARRVMDMVEAGKKSIRLVDVQGLIKEGLILEHQYRSGGDMKKFMQLIIDTFSEP